MNVQGPSAARSKKRCITSNKFCSNINMLESNIKKEKDKIIQ